MRVLVCGSRDWTDQEAIVNRIALLPSDAVVVHGGARGADRIAGAAAEILGHEVKVFRADWNKYGKAAGILRNLQMLDTRPDRVIAFWDGVSPGTQHTIEEARRRGIKVEVIRG